MLASDINRSYVGRAIDRFVAVVNQLVSDTPLSISDFKDYANARWVMQRARQRKIDFLGS
jgi:hypothetical protein